MKKLFVIILSVAMLCVTSVAAFAASPITTVGGTDSASVKGTYVEGGKSTKIYRVDITWGSMEFTYTDAAEGTWNPEKHTFEGTGTATWTCPEGANEIKVTNHSNDAVKATFTYAASEGYEAVSGSFDKAEVRLDSAVGTTFDSAPVGTAKLALTGALPAGTSGATIGTVTVKLGN